MSKILLAQEVRIIPGVGDRITYGIVGFFKIEDIEKALEWVKSKDDVEYYSDKLKARKLVGLEEME